MIDPNKIVKPEKPKKFDYIKVGMKSPAFGYALHDFESALLKFQQEVEPTKLIEWRDPKDQLPDRDNWYYLMIDGVVLTNQYQFDGDDYFWGDNDEDCFSLEFRKELKYCSISEREEAKAIEDSWEPFGSGWMGAGFNCWSNPKREIKLTLIGEYYRLENLINDRLYILVWEKQSNGVEIINLAIEGIKK